MSKKLFLLFFVMSALFAGCNSRYLYYHSIAGIPQKSNSVKSDIKYVSYDGKREIGMNYSILIARDTNLLTAEATYYLMLSNNIIGSNAEQITFGNVAVLPPSKVRELIQGIDFAIEDMNNRHRDTTATFYEFVSVPEFLTQKVSENTEQWDTYIKFIYSNSRQGRQGKLVITRPNLFMLDRSSEFSDAESLTVFKNHLEKALKELEAMGYQKNETVSKG